MSYTTTAVDVAAVSSWSSLRKQTYGNTCKHTQICAHIDTDTLEHNPTVVLNVLPHTLVSITAFPAQGLSHNFSTQASQSKDTTNTHSFWISSIYSAKLIDNTSECTYSTVLHSCIACTYKQSQIYFISLTFECGKKEHGGKSFAIMVLYFNIQNEMMQPNQKWYYNQEELLSLGIQRRSERCGSSKERQNDGIRNRPLCAAGYYAVNLLLLLKCMNFARIHRGRDITIWDYKLHYELKERLSGSPHWKAQQK